MEQFPKSKKFLGLTLELHPNSNETTQSWVYWKGATYVEICYKLGEWLAHYQYSTPNSYFRLDSNWVKTEKSARRYVSEALRKPLK